MKEVDELNAAELNNAIEAEVFGALPLSDDEWDICKCMYVMLNGPHALQGMSKLIKRPLDEPDFSTGLKFWLAWPREYARPEFDASRMLVTRMRELGWLFDICDYETSNNKVIKTAGFQKLGVRVEANADTDVLAIARAALMAVRAWKKEHEKNMANTL